MQKKHRQIGVIGQIYIIIFIGIVITGAVTYFIQYHKSNIDVRTRTEELSAEIAEGVTNCVTKYPAYEWLLRYWYEHADEMDVEYDMDYVSDSPTLEKFNMLLERNYGLQIQYADEETLAALPAQDQKMYAEVIYSWLIAEVDSIKQSFDTDYLFCVVTDTDEGENPYQTQLFLFSGADKGAERGQGYEQIYLIGKFVSVADNPSQQEAMRTAVRRRLLTMENTVHDNTIKDHLAAAGDYVDYYTYLSSFDDKAVLIGITYNVADLMKNVSYDTLRATAIAVGLQILLLTIIMIFIVVDVIKPLKDVAKNIRTYKETKDSETVNDNLRKMLEDRMAFGVRRNEVGQLAGDVIELTSEIDDYVDRIEDFTAKNERIESELAVGAHIQANVLPTKFPAFPDRVEFDLYATMTPAKEVGGDFYDFFLIDDDHLALVIADVSGKGIPAALFMMATKIVINNKILIERSPAKALELTNNEICINNREEMFVTVWLGVLEISTGKITASNAGHEFPALRTAGGDFELFKDKHGFVIGGMEDMKYKDYEIQLEPGMKLFVYTDGVPEAANAHNELFGNERMISSLNRVKDGSCEEVLNGVRKDIGTFVGEAEQFDDLTMLCLEYRGK